MSGLRARLLPSLAGIAPDLWDACAHAGATVESGSEPADSFSESDPLNPFVSHAFLSSLEEAGCVGPGTGWAPAHLVLEDADGTLLAAAPAYRKSHSQGEYVFDHGWAEAYQRAGGRYYPKLQVAVPFTPATGPRLLVRHDTPHPPAALRGALTDGLMQLTEQAGCSSLHITFPHAVDADHLAQSGLMTRHDIQYHWLNEGFASYDDFLATLAARKRKALKRERREALAAGIIIRHLTGPDLTEAVWDAFFVFYMETASRKWGRPYLNRRFFSLIGERMAERIVLVIAERGGRMIAGAINFLGATRLYGRHWGAIEEHPFLHFELCYHQAIEIAIARGLKVVEAGAQGEHKLARGYRPMITTSAHHIRHPGLARAVADYLDGERQEIARLREAMLAEMPFRQTDEPAP